MAKGRQEKEIKNIKDHWWEVQVEAREEYMGALAEDPNCDISTFCESPKGKKLEEKNGKSLGNAAASCYVEVEMIKARLRSDRAKREGEENNI